MSIKNKIQLFCKRYRIYIIIGIILFIFPLVIGLIYNIQIPQIIAVESGDLLSYYATAFGIFGSFVIYLADKERKTKERLDKLEPNLSIEIMDKDKDTNIFNLKVTNNKPENWYDLSIYYESALNHFKNTHTLKIIFSDEDDVSCGVDVIKVNEEYLDNNEYPKTIIVCCHDVDENLWECEYKRMINGSKILYEKAKSSRLKWKEGN